MKFYASCMHVMHTLLTINFFLFFLCFIPPPYSISLIFSFFYFLTFLSKLSSFQDSSEVLNIFMGQLCDPIKIQNKNSFDSNMGTKVKGLIRGIKKQIFDEEKEQEITIGAPTDVKHVAHIGCDGPAAESPSWMKGFDTSQSGPLDKTGDMVETPEVNWVSEDSSNRKARKDDSRHRNSRSVETSRDLPLLPRSTKNRHRSMDNTMATESLSKDSSSSKSRHTRRHRRGSRRSKDQNAGDDAKSDIPKRSSRRSRKSKEESSGEGSTRSSTKSIGDESELGSELGSDNV